MPTPLRVLDAARSIVDEVNRLLGRRGHKLIYEVQLQDSSGSMAANIREALGRREGPERNQFIRFARGSAEETDEHLRANYAADRLSEAHYWRLHNRLTTIIKMLNGLMKSAPSGPAADRRSDARRECATSTPKVNAVSKRSM